MTSEWHKEMTSYWRIKNHTHTKSQTDAKKNDARLSKKMTSYWRIKNDVILTQKNDVILTQEKWRHNWRKKKWRHNWPHCWPCRWPCPRTRLQGRQSQRRTCKNEKLIWRIFFSLAPPLHGADGLIRQRKCLVGVLGTYGLTHSFLRGSFLPPN